MYSGSVCVRRQFFPRQLLMTVSIDCFTFLLFPGVTIYERKNIEGRSELKSNVSYISTWGEKNVRLKIGSFTELLD